MRLSRIRADRIYFEYPDPDLTPSYLLLENGSYFLLENGGRLIL